MARVFIILILMLLPVSVMSQETTLTEALDELLSSIETLEKNSAERAILLTDLENSIDQTEKRLETQETLLKSLERSLKLERQTTEKLENSLRNEIYKWKWITAGVSVLGVVSIIVAIVL